MKTISMIGIAAALSLPALAAAQRGGGAGAGAVSVQRVQVQRIDVGRADTSRMITARDIEIRRGNAYGGETGTRLRHRDGPDRPPPHDPARRRWNAAHPSGPDPSRPNAGR